MSEYTYSLGAPDVEYRVPDSVRTTVHPDGTVTHENPDNWTPPVAPKEKKDMTTTTRATLLVRKTTKTSYAQAAKVPTKDGAERLAAIAEGMNELVGWKKYAVAPAGGEPELTMEGEDAWEEGR